MIYKATAALVLSVAFLFAPFAGAKKGLGSFSCVAPSTGLPENQVIRRSPVLSTQVSDLYYACGVTRYFSPVLISR
jgi:hypothetical protein